MIFDTFCGMAERHWEPVIPLLRKAHLFEFPENPQDVLRKSFEPEEVELLRETFFLPFPVVAIEDPVSCVLLFDKVQDQQGINTERFFAECLPLDLEHLSRAADTTPEDLAYLSTIPPGFVQISFGRIEEFTIGTKPGVPPIGIRGVVEKLILCDKRKVHAMDGEVMRRVGGGRLSGENVLKNVKTAFEEIFHFNTPNRFVVERSEIQPRPPPPHLQVLRSDHRARYILLTPKEIGERWSEDASTPVLRLDRVAHHRRRHYRRLSSERYKDARGKVLCIPATWVGPDECKSGRTRYKVRLDL